MKKHNEFIDYLNETFEEFGLIEARRMFGGYGIYHDGIMFGLVENNTLYLKADKTTKEHFESRGLKQFQYDRAGKTVKMSYYQAPEEIYDDRDEAALWAGRAYEVALKQKQEEKQAKKDNLTVHTFLDFLKLFYFVNRTCQSLFVIVSKY